MAKKNFLARIKEAIDSVFDGIARRNSVGYEISELNLEENLKHSFSDKEDNLPLTSTELATYKQLFIDIYNKRHIYHPFLSNDENFIDPLRVGPR